MLKNIRINMKAVYLLLSVLFLSSTFEVQAQTRNKIYEDYIKKYREIAVHEMKKHHIPASITLAQGLLESGAGRGELARKANNHFGIKCGGRWSGRTVRHDDDARNECFRAYKNAEDSYKDHSKFLRDGARYQFLFDLKITDYKGWAKGLKKAGYATDPKYAYRLINLIELYDLYEYDRKGGLKWLENNPNPHQPYIANELVYVVARRGDTFKTLSKELGISSRKLRSYNELPKDYTFRGGEIVYLEKKHKRATKGNIVYVVKSGDSMYSIAQKYGIRLSNLYKLNKMDKDAGVPQAGTILRLR